MSIKSDVQEAIKQAMKDKNIMRLECLRLAKAALLLKEKESAKDQELTNEDAVKALRSEVRKRQQSIETYKGLDKMDEVAKLEAEIAVLDEFLPKQLSPEDVEEKVRAYLTEHPDLNHAGKLTGAMKKELGDLVDGKVLNEICRKVLEA
ncbi:MAG TPA: GatB/YqeY domain-containing protein [Candidatus Hydrogenedentes bacterium]|nr:GatB/YqeY domain-containing protein [Candidatus Hydrogenedentota bacterium]